MSEETPLRIVLIEEEGFKKKEEFMEECSFDDHGLVEVNCTENGGRNEFINGSLSKNDDGVNWSDSDENLRCLFDQVLMVLLRGVYSENGGRPIPALLGDGQTVDLFKLFCLVRERGGFHSVSEDKLWGLIAEKFGFDCTFCGSLKLIYYRYLDELDQWLNRISRDRVSENGSYECGGSLGLLSIELESRLRNFSADEKDFPKDGGSRYDNVSNCIDVAVKENFAEEGTEVHNVVVQLAGNDKVELCDSKVFPAKTMGNVIDNNIATRKRKRDMIGATLSWMIRVAKNPCHPSIGALPGCSRGKERSFKDFRSLALSFRDARLRKRYTDLNDQQSQFLQKKHKMHPSMYEDNNVSDHLSAEGGLRSSERLLSLSNSTCQCCSPSSNNHCKFKNASESFPENGLHKQELLNADVSDTKEAVNVEDAAFENHILVGPRFQAEVPLWTGIISESDPKWLGTQVWTPDLQEDNSLCETELLEKGRPESCNCFFPGSVECYRFHIVEKRLKLRRELGLTFFRWKFDSMGEEVSLSWSAAEEKTFKEVVKLKSSFLGKSIFSKKTRKELVSYYYNVFIIKRRSYQNRVTPKDIDSDDDEAVFGSVSQAFGYNAVKVRGSEPLECIQNEQVMDFD